MFPDSGSVIADLLTEVLVSLDPPLGVCFERAIVGQPNVLALLCGFSQVRDYKYSVLKLCVCVFDFF